MLGIPCSTEKGDSELGPCFFWVGFRQVRTQEKHEWRKLGMLPSHLGSS